MRVIPINPGFVCKIEGCDAANVSVSEVGALKAAMADYAVVVLPGQQLSDEAQVAFARQFGPLDTYPEATRGYNRGMSMDLLPISNAADQGGAADLDDRRRILDIGNKFWHTDSSFKAVTAHLSMLYATQVTSEGGQTQFADMRAGYDALSDDWKMMIDGLIVEHNVMHSRMLLGYDGWTDEERAAIGASTAHDLVRTLPESGRKTLYLSAHAAAIVGLSLPVGRMLLHELTELATSQNNIYSHTWRPNDFVIWDNRCTVHRLRRYKASTELRVMRRVTTLDPTFPARDPALVRVPEWVVRDAA